MRIHHICIQTDDYQSSLGFYRDLLGFDVVEETAGFHGRYYNSWLQLGEFMIELQTNREGESLVDVDKSSKGIVHFCLFTEDLQQAYEAMVAKGFSNFIRKHDHPIYEVNGGQLLKMIAPEGTIIELRDSMIQ